MASISKNVYIDKFGDVVNEHNNEDHITIKVKPVDAKSSIYIEFVKEINNNYLKFNSMVTM